MIIGVGKEMMPLPWDPRPPHSSSWPPPQHPPQSTTPPPSHLICWPNPPFLRTLYAHIRALLSAWSLRPQALTSCFSGAPEMRYSVLNRTGGLFPAEKLGLSVTFFLQGRTRQPLQDSQAPFLPAPQS